MKNLVTLQALTNSALNRAIDRLANGTQLRGQSITLDTTKHPENTLGGKVAFELPMMDDEAMLASTIDFINEGFARNGISAWIGTLPTLENIHEIAKAGKLAIVNYTGVKVLVELTELTENKHCHELHYRFVNPGIVQWGEFNYSKGWCSLRKGDGYLSGTIAFIN